MYSTSKRIKKFLKKAGVRGAKSLIAKGLTVTKKDKSSFLKRRTDTSEQDEALRV
eukprot:CAMPEP_0194444086 /NCGR_PEP_ID=MMETSP0176-20130528/127067_1 /TAXON_ID=216777 /ORGANISM="Proboscia alata, Strain PI-D3" /LENGTH=54 /DNA_ID=CAMNT_0039270407 /DNA_START=770 /DNA_END=934 /DNA_ORIENTATION=+